MPPEMRLLLLLSRPTLTTEQRDMAAKLIAHVTQWPTFVDTACRKFVLPMVYQNLANVPSAVPPDEALRAMREVAMQVTSEMLRRQAAFDWFHTHCVLPSRIDHAYFKGPALAARFYPDPMQRFYRDVDILVPPKAQADALGFMLSQGCRAFHFVGSRVEFIDLDRASALHDLLFTTPVPHLLTPCELVVELHSQIDQQTDLFDTETMLNNTRSIATQHHTIRTLPDAAHVAFTCYHHTRHLWSKLNWLADLDVVFGQMDFDRDAVLDHARSLNIGKTVEAAMKLHELTSAARHSSDFDHATPGVDLLRACETGLHGDLELEREMRKRHRMNVIAFEWQPVPVSLARRAWLQMSKFRPAHEDLSTLPVYWPRSLRLTAAYWFKFKRSIRRRMSRDYGA